MRVGPAIGRGTFARWGMPRRCVGHCLGQSYAQAVPIDLSARSRRARVPWKRGNAVRVRGAVGVRKARPEETRERRSLQTASV